MPASKSETAHITNLTPIHSWLLVCYWWCRCTVAKQQDELRCPIAQGWSEQSCIDRCQGFCAIAYCPVCQWHLPSLFHHHHRVAHPSVSTVISTSWRHFEQSCARIHAVLRPRLWGRRSSSIVRSHVCLGRPVRRRQSAGGRIRLMAARRMRTKTKWSCDGSALARCPNRRSHLFAITEVTGGWPVLRLTSSLVICAVYGICTIWRRQSQMHRDVDWRPQSYSMCQLRKEASYNTYNAHT